MSRKVGDYYEIRIEGANDSKITLFYPTFKGSTDAKRHATTMANRLGRWKRIEIWYVKESFDHRLDSVGNIKEREYVSGRGKGQKMDGRGIWVDYE